MWFSLYYILFLIKLFLYIFEKIIIFKIDSENISENEYNKYFITAKD